MTKRLYNKGQAFELLIVVYCILLLAVAFYYSFSDLAQTPIPNTVGQQMLYTEEFADSIEFQLKTALSYAQQTVTPLSTTSCTVTDKLEIRTFACAQSISQSYTIPIENAVNQYARTFYSPFQEIAYRSEFLVAIRSDKLYAVGVEPFRVYQNGLDGKSLLGSNFEWNVILPSDYYVRDYHEDEAFRYAYYYSRDMSVSVPLSPTIKEVTTVAAAYEVLTPQIRAILLEAANDALLDADPPAFFDAQFPITQQLIENRLLDQGLSAEVSKQQNEIHIDFASVRLVYTLPPLTF